MKVKLLVVHGGVIKGGVVFKEFGANVLYILSFVVGGQVRLNPVLSVPWR